MAAQQALPTKQAADPLDGPPFVTCKGWAVADGKTGQVLWGMDEGVARPMASTTKIMTAWIVLSLAGQDAKVLEEILTVSERPTGPAAAPLTFAPASSWRSRTSSMACCCRPATTPRRRWRSISVRASPTGKRESPRTSSSPR